MKLSKDRTNVPKKDPCCETSLDEFELFCFDSNFEISSKLTESKKSALYYVCGYITLKDRFFGLENATLDNINESEFSKLVSGEQLSHASEDLYGLFQYLLANRLIEAIQVISNVG